MRTTASPSESTKDAASVKRTVESPTGPRYGRPSDRFGPPMALFSPELALLRYDLKHLDTLTPDSVGAHRAFAFVASFEDKREAELRYTLGELLRGQGLRQVSIAGGSTQPDGVLLEDIFAYPIVEITNDPGHGGDPFLRGLVAYSKVVARQEVQSSSCPLRSTKMHQAVSPIP